jgi:hypothetical protein
MFREIGRKQISSLMLEKLMDDEWMLEPGSGSNHKLSAVKESHSLSALRESRSRDLSNASVAKDDDWVV